MKVKVLLLIGTPDGFDGWSTTQKLDRYHRVVEWHHYIQELSPRVVTHVWGSSQILNHRDLSSNKDLYVVVAQFNNLGAYDRFMYDDPLRNVSKYMTALLTDLNNDWVDDLQRYNDAKMRLIGGAEDVPPEYSSLRRQFKSRPDYVGQYKFTPPKNPPVPYGKDWQRDDARFIGKPLSILIYGMNPTELMTWSDARQLIHYEKVIWWHHHIAQMLTENRVSHVWGTHDFCSNASVSGNSASAATIYRAKDLDEFDSIYRLDPLRTAGRFISVILKPIQVQRVLDERRLRSARTTRDLAP